MDAGLRRDPSPRTTCLAGGKGGARHGHQRPSARIELPPIEDAKRQYVELFGSALVMNTYLKIALLCVSLVALGLLAAQLPHGQSKYANVEAAGHSD